MKVDFQRILKDEYALLAEECFHEGWIDYLQRQIEIEKFEQYQSYLFSLETGMTLASEGKVDFSHGCGLERVLYHLNSNLDEIFGEDEFKRLEEYEKSDWDRYDAYKINEMDRCLEEYEKSDWDRYDAYKINEMDRCLEEDWKREAWENYNCDDDWFELDW